MNLSKLILVFFSFAYLTSTGLVIGADEVDGYEGGKSKFARSTGVKKRTPKIRHDKDEQIKKVSSTSKVHLEEIPERENIFEQNPVRPSHTGLETEGQDRKEMTTFSLLKQWAKQLKKELLVLYLSSQDTRTPLYAKSIAFFTVAYALSPIDLIPDFIPVIGYLDDLIIVPAGILLARKMTPAHVLEDCRRKVDNGAQFNMNLKWIGLFSVVSIWALTSMSVYHFMW